MIGRRGFLGLLGGALAGTRTLAQGTAQAAEVATPTVPEGTAWGVVDAKEPEWPRVRVETLDARGNVVPNAEWTPRTHGFICSGWVNNADDPEVGNSFPATRYFVRTRCDWCGRWGSTDRCEGCGAPLDFGGGRG